MKHVSLTTRALFALLTLVVITLPAHAVTEERFSLFWQDWQVLGATGSSVVVGQLDGGLPNLDHSAWSGAHIVPIVYPLPLEKITNVDPFFNRQFHFTSHATATLGAIGARNTSLGNSPLGGIKGFAPEATLLAAGYGNGFSLDTGATTGITFEAIFFSLMMLADQDFADAAIGDLTTYWNDYVTRHTNPFTGEPDLQAAAIHPSFLTQGPYRVATIINIPFSNTENAKARAGDDPVAQIANMVVAMTPATLVAAAGNSGDRQDIETLDPPQGSVGSPSTAANVISVGFTETGRDGQIDKNSSNGPSWKGDRRVDAQLIDPDAPTLTPPPTVSPIPEIVSGVTIAAPGVELELPGSFIALPLDNSAFVKGWTGSSMASSIVAGALAQLHDLHRKRYFLENPNDPLGEFSPKAILPSVVTRAILYNSANKEQGFRNLAIPSQADNNALVTAKPFDNEVGAGRLHMRRLLNQYLSTPALGGYQDLDGNTNDNDGAEVFVLRRDPSILLPTDTALDSANTYTINDINGVPISFRGTDPNKPSITFYKKPGQDDRGGGLRQAASRSTPVPSDKPFIPTIDVPDASYVAFAQAQLIPPGALGDLGGGGSFGNGSGLNSPSTGNGLTLGETTVSGGTATGNVGSTLADTNPSNPIGDLFSSGWDHGMIGVGFLDMPLGLITKGSTISATVSWNEVQILDQRFIDTMKTSVSPANLRATSRALTRSLVHQATAAGVPVPEPGSAAAKALLAPYPTERTVEDLSTGPQQYFEPTVMAGYSVSPTNPPPGFDPAQNDDPNDFYDYNTNTGHVDKLSDGTLNPQSSAFRGVCHITAQISSATLSFTGVAVGPRHILTAAHNFDLNNDGFDQTNQVTIQFTGIGGDGVIKTYGPSDLAKVEAHPGYVGIGINLPNGNSPGFSDDLALITLKDAIDFTVDGIPIYAISSFDQTTLPGPSDPPLDIIIVGFGESGFGDIGADSTQFPSNGLVRRIGWNQLKNNFIVGKSKVATVTVPKLLQSYRYDFDGPAGIFGQGILNDGITIGNKRETIHTTGDSGGPAFRWFDSGDGLGGAPDGKIQEAELRIFGINTARLSGSAQTIDQFGATGIGVLLNSYSNAAEPSWDNWIINTINAPPPPPLPPISSPIFIFSGDAAAAAGFFGDVVEWDLENLDLEVYRKNFDGSGNQLVAASRSLAYTNEMVFVQNDENLITLGNYFARIVYTDTIWDFGGFLFNDAPSNPQVNARGVAYKNTFNSEVQYGFAYYVDLIRDPNIFGFRSTSTRGADGSLTVTQEPYLKVRYEDLIGDMNADADIDGQDLGALLSLWGKTGIAGQTRGDLNADGIVNSGDLAVLLMHYTGAK